MLNPSPIDEKLIHYRKTIENLINDYLLNSKIAKKDRLDSLCQLVLNKNIVPLDKRLKQFYFLFSEESLWRLTKEITWQKIETTISRTKDFESASTVSQMLAYALFLKREGLNAHLTYEGFSQFSMEKLRTLGTILKEVGITLGFYRQFLNELTMQQWHAFGVTLKKVGITSLNFKNNEFHKFTLEQWQAFGAAIKEAGVTCLSLEQNGLWKLSIEQWQAFGIALKETGVASLDLNYNSLCELSLEEWHAFGEVFKGSRVTSLNLSDNYLAGLTIKQWHAFGEALKKAGVTCLGLAGNRLDKLDIEQWQAFSLVLEGAGVVSLDLRYNRLDVFNRFKWWKPFEAALRTSMITEVKFEHDFYEELSKKLVTICHENYTQKIKQEKQIIGKNPQGKLTELIGITLFKQWNLKIVKGSHENNNNNPKLVASFGNAEFDVEVEITDEEEQVLNNNRPTYKW